MRIIRPVPVLPPLWRTASKPRTIFFEHDSDNGSGEWPPPLPQMVAARELHAARGPALAFDLLRQRDGTHHLFLSWNHTLLDARGVELLLSHVNGASSMNGAATQNLVSPKQQGWNLTGWWPNAKTGARFREVAQRVRARAAVHAGAGRAAGGQVPEPLPPRFIQPRGHQLSSASAASA